MSRSPPRPPHPGIVRRARESFGWLEVRLLHDRWLADLGPDATATLLLFALAANCSGASWYARGTMAALLGLDLVRIDRALELLLDRGLVAFRPWKPGSRDGVWQLMPLPEPDRAS